MQSKRFKRTRFRPRFRDRRTRVRTESGQASVEYALVLLAAAVVASVLISWVTKTNLLGALFDFIMETIRGKVS